MSTYITLTLSILHTGILTWGCYSARFSQPDSWRMPLRALHLLWVLWAAGCGPAFTLPQKIEQFGVVDLQERKQEDGSYRVDGKWMD
jgi:hypothetical protein